jgi:NAD(P)-dependent dehydrogenase (short-subunit alcohol dehydrogenase family)
MKALVLGGKGDIGNAISERLTHSGHEVFSVGRDDFDLTDNKQIKKFFADKDVNFDILIHSAGHNIPKSFASLREEEIRQSIDANIIGFLEVTRLCIPYWNRKKQGKIVVLSSLYGFFGRSGRLPYVMSKHALNGVVKTLAIELASSNVLVNSVSPGYIATALTYRNNTPSDIEKLISGIPLQRLGTASEIANIVEFLCSAQNTYINGQDIIVDGGFSIGGFL